MKFFIAVLTASVVFPIGAALGWAAHKDSDPPSFTEYVTEVQGLQLSKGLSSDDWTVVPTTGPFKGQAVDLFQVFMAYPTEPKLEAAAQGKIAYYEDNCKVYSPGGKAKEPKVLVQRCTHVKHTRAQAESYFGNQLVPRVKA